MIIGFCQSIWKPLVLKWNWKLEFPFRDKNNDDDLHLDLWIEVLLKVWFIYDASYVYISDRNHHCRNILVTKEMLESQLYKEKTNNIVYNKSMNERILTFFSQRSIAVYYSGCQICCNWSRFKPWFNVPAHRNTMPQINIIPHPVTVYWYWSNQSCFIP